MIDDDNQIMMIDNNRMMMIDVDDADDDRW